MAVLDEGKALFPILCSKLAQAAQKGGSKLDEPAAVAPHGGGADGVHALSQQHKRRQNGHLPIYFSSAKNAFGSRKPPFEGKNTRIIDKQDKEPASAARRLGHKCPQCGHFSEITDWRQKFPRVSFWQELYIRT